MKRVLIILLVVAVAASAWYVYHTFTAKVKSLEKVEADIHVSASELVAAFQKDSSAASRIYPGKILQVNGNIKTIEGESSTIVFGDENSMWSVRCSMDSAYAGQIAALNPGNSITVRGNYAGFNADELGLGSDIVLNRCVLITNQLTK